MNRMKLFVVWLLIAATWTPWAQAEPKPYDPLADRKADYVGDLFQTPAGLVYRWTDQNAWTPANVGAGGGDPVLAQGINLTPMIEVCTGDGDGTGANALPCPTDGNSVDLLNIPSGAGVIHQIQFTVEGGDFAKHGRLAIFYDGALWPQFYVDFGTYAGTGFGGSGAGNVLKMARWEGSTHPTRPDVLTAVMRFKVPFKNGVRVALVNDGVANILSGGSSAFFSHVDVRPSVSVPSPYQLVSACQPFSKPVELGVTDPMLYFSWPGATGVVVYRSFAMQGVTNRSYLEKNTYLATGAQVGHVAMDPGGNPIATDLAGTVLPGGASFSGNGTEDDTVDTGFYAMDDKFFSAPFEWMSVNDLTTFAFVGGRDFIGGKGGFPFAGGVEGGKGWQGSTTAERSCHCHLLYIDTSIPQRPSAPELTVVSANASSVTLKLDTMRMTQGSSPVTSFEGTYTSTAGNGTFTIAAGATTKTVTGLTSNAAYTFSCHGVNAVGAGTQSPGVTGTPFGPLAPNAVAGLRLWFDAGAITGSPVNDAPVASWTDRSTHLTHAVQATGTKQPLFKTNVINGLPAVHFDGIDDVLKVPAISAMTSGTMFVVLRRLGTLRDFARVFEIGENSNFTVANSAVSGSFLGNGRLLIAAAYSLETLAPLTVGQAYIASATTTPSSTKAYLDGVLQGSGVPTGLIGGSLPAAIGNLGSAETLAWSGEVAEIIVYDTVLSLAEYSGVQLYLADKYGITLVVRF